MSTKTKTPFVYGKIATGADFTNREQESKRLKQNLAAGVNSILISPRRWGKSSLVSKVAKSFERDKSVRVCFIDLYNVRTEQEFYQAYIRELMRISASKWTERVSYAKQLFKKIIPVFSVGLDPNTEFSVSIDIKELNKAPEEILNLAETICKSKKIKIIVCIDEFQNIGFFDNPVAFQKKLRAHWQHHQKTTYCLYGSKRHMMMQLFASPSMPFYKFGDTIFLEKITLDYWKNFIVNRFTDTGKTISEKLATTIATSMENHPYFVQQLAQGVWFRTQKVCTNEIVETALNDLLLQHSILFQREVDNLSNMQLNFLRAMTKDVKQFSAQETLAEFKLGTSANVLRIKDALINKEIIDTLNKEIVFLDPLFKHWLIKNYFTAS